MKQNILFVSHKEKQCGVYQYGQNIGNALRKSIKYNFIYNECSCAKELLSFVNAIMPSAVIYNYYPSTMPWLKRKVIRAVKAPQIGIIHEVTQHIADLANDSFFQYHIAPDPTLLIKNPIVFKTGRLIPNYVNKHEFPKIPTIGSFGFGTEGKGFEKLIETVQNEFDDAVIKLHIPFATFGDSHGKKALAIAQQCKELIVKPSIKLMLSHNFLRQEQLLDFLAQNSVNAFFYEENKGRGISSVIDFALAVQRPIAITRSNMFRHILSIYPPICIEESNLKTIMENGFEPLRQYYQEWSEENLIWDYERIIGKVVNHEQKRSSGRTLNRLKSIFLRFRAKTSKDLWIPPIKKDETLTLRIKGDKSLPISIPNVTSFNRILDDSARQQYKPVIDWLFKLLPTMMARKMPAANIQQAFVLDSVVKLASNYSSPRILCIGSYNDTAAAALKNTGYRMDEVDPVYNYDLNTFFYRPSTAKRSYNVIFSTSVLEHVKNDELFMTQIAELLAPGGIAILTVDFSDQYKTGDPIPSEDFRLYTQRDFKERLLPLLRDCELVDEPQWNCQNPDFTYSGCTYTFATLVIRKKKAMGIIALSQK